MKPQSPVRSIPLLSLVLIAGVLAMGANVAQAATPLGIEVLSSQASRVTGGDALIGVTATDQTARKKMVVRLNGRVVTGSFQNDPQFPLRRIGVVYGMKEGRNWISAWAPGQNSGSRLAVYNSSLQGPVFSGPHQEPFYCTTQKHGLGPSQNADCYAPTKISWYYRASDSSFKPLSSPTDRPADLVQTTTRTGQTVDYVVRLEQGVINRAVYSFATLAAGGRAGDGWNGRFFYLFGGGCSAGYQQGNNMPDTLDNDLLSRGFVVLSSTLNVFNNSCNDVLSAETTSLVKERAIESLGRPDAWTAGQGGSGGSVQIQMIAQNYPGLLDGINPGASFPDNSAPDYPDCRLLVNYFENTPSGQNLSNAQRRSITGMTSNSNGGCNPLANGGDVVNASEGCVEQIVPASVIFDAFTNPKGVRCTLWDNMINVYGSDPSTGYARRSLDNVGVQYGLESLQQGDIGLVRFLNLNEFIGGYDNNGNFQAGRSVADPAALRIGYETGRIQQGAGAWSQTPVVDTRNYQDDAGSGNVHQYVNTYRTRARLDRFLGNHENQVMFRAQGGANVRPMNSAAIDILSTWLDNVIADDSPASLAQKVVSNKPADAVDACWIGGKRINEPAVVGGDGPCQAAYPPHSLPVNRAGRPLDSITAKCALKPIDLSDYGAANENQIVRLNQIFPSGVCDWSRPGPEETTVEGTDISFGPAQASPTVSRRLGLKLNRYKVNRSRKGASVKLTASLNPCPAVTWQRIRFERRIKQGRKWIWKSIGSKMATGDRCRASVRTRKLKKPTRLRAKALPLDGFRAASSPVRKVKVKPARRHRR